MPLSCSSLAATNIRYQITGGNIGNAFAVQNTTGVIYVASPLDYETRPKVSQLSVRPSIWVPVSTSSSCWQALLKAEALTFQFLFLVSAASSFITFFLSSSSSCSVCVFFVRVSTFDCACIIYIYFCCLTDSTRKICKTMQNFQANNFPTLRSATQPKKAREKGRKKLIKKICAHAKTRTRTHTQLICARVYVCVWQIVLADLQLLVHIPLCVFSLLFRHYCTHTNVEL